MSGACGTYEEEQICLESTDGKKWNQETAWKTRI